MSTKKIMALLLAISTATVLAGCGEKKKNATQGAKVTVNGDDIYPVECEDTLTYWMSLSGSTAQHYKNFGDTPVAKELEKATGIKVEYIHASEGDSGEQLQLLMASDGLPDIVEHSWNLYSGGPQAALDEDLIMDLTDIVDKYAPALKKVLKGNSEYDRSVKTDDGKYYAFPFLLEEGILQYFYGPIVRKDWLDKTGLSAPETIDEWETMLRAFKNECGAEMPYTGDLGALLMTFGPGFNTYYDPFNPFYVNDGKVVYGPYTQEFKALLQKLHDWYAEGLIDNDFAVYDAGATASNMLSGKCGVRTGYAGGTIGDYLSAEPDDPAFDLCGIRYPAAEKGSVPEYSCVSGVVNMNSSAAISTNCKNPELAARLLDYGFTEAGHNLFNFGIEGESYNWEDGYPKYTELITDNPDGWSVSEAMAAYMRSSDHGIMIQDTRYIEQYYKLPQQKEAQQEWKNSNMKKHNLPTIYIDPQYSDKDADIMTNVRTYAEEMMAKFITGDKSLEEYDDYLAQLKKFGIEDSIKYRQEAYERYLKR